MSSEQQPLMRCLQTAVIDRPTLQKLQAVIGGDIDELQELILDFITDLDEQTQNMHVALVNNDLTALRISAHCTKSNSRDFGALSLAESCTRLERQCELEDAENLGVLVTLIDKEVQLVIQALQQSDLHDDPF